jgi:hypothetical protein
MDHSRSGVGSMRSTSTTLVTVVDESAVKVRAGASALDGTAGTVDPKGLAKTHRL